MVAAPVVAAPVVNDGRIVASPRAKKLASQMGVDLATVRGTGPHGRIQAEDVQQAWSARFRAPGCRRHGPAAVSSAGAAAAAAPSAPAGNSFGRPAKRCRSTPSRGR